ncbi:hypothetical protein [Curtobacterium sp. MCJR17_043]|uniref:hypothetical protein n=1 Tax=Curtobacterium sp. MCJR17_043 TaxID=2175660 RepID=UPI0024DFBFDC|nr:hypothetical protein [Curtobacterium sp. MCJR17_043]WIB34814.1 hypothetical protein DEJ15_09550 [Curtobacterium sp. MCJR17_043]
MPPGADGRDGRDGKDGLPGVNAIANDDANATLIATPGTATNSALASFGMSAPPISNRAQLITYGHSFLAEQGLADASRYWARRLAKALGLTYPTSDGGAANDLKRAIGGSSIGDTLGRVGGATGFGDPQVPRWVPGTKALVVLQCLMNTLRLRGATDLDLRSATNYGRAMLAILSASEIIDDSDPRITKSTGTAWASQTSGFPLNGSSSYNATNGAYFEYTVPSNRDAYIVTLSRGGGTAGVIVDITDQTAGTVLVSGLDLSNQTISASGIYAWRTPASARGARGPFHQDGGGSALNIDAVLPVSLTPPPVLWMKEPYLANYAASTQFPNGSDAAVNSFNAIVDLLAAEFSNVIVADPNQFGYWDKTTDILTSDQVHPNEKGHFDLARTGIDAIRAWQTRKALALV